MINVGIYGVTGYAGYELLRWIGRHISARPPKTRKGRPLTKRAA